MVLIAVTCPYCHSDRIAKRGKTETGKQRYQLVQAIASQQGAKPDDRENCKIRQ
jgi:hypothetical protein